MNLVFDFGNTLHKCAVFDGELMLFQKAKEQFSFDDFQYLHNNFAISAVIQSNVDNIEESVLAQIQTFGRYFELSHTTHLPIQNTYTTPETLGKDRLASAVGANNLFPNSNVLVIDAGTCIKYDFVDSSNIYRGGAISPGLTMRLQAMHNLTARLPLIPPLQQNEQTDIALIGNSTESAMISGTYNGAFQEIKGIIEEYASKHDNLTVVMSGGDAHFFELHFKRQIFARPNLVLEGLNTILNFNLTNY